MEVFMEMGVWVWRGRYGVCTAHPSTPSYPESLITLYEFYICNPSKKCLGLVFPNYLLHALHISYIFTSYMLMRYRC